MTVKLLASFTFVFAGALTLATPSQAGDAGLGLAPDAPAAVTPAYNYPQYRCTGGEFGRPKYCYKVPTVRRPSIGL